MDVPAYIQTLWDTYDLPAYKRNHSMWVSVLAVWFARHWMMRRPTEHVDVPVLRKAALLHDLDKNMEKKNGEHHPDATVRVLRIMGQDDVADVIATHPLHMILDPARAPKTREQTLLYLADKMVKHSIITVDERFALWQAEHLPADAVAVLDAAYPKVKALEHDVCSVLGVDANAIGLLVKEENSGTIES